MYESKPKNKHDYAFSVAVVRTLETMLLDDNKVERMVLADNTDDTFKIFNESDYSDNTEGINDPADFQKVIDEGILEIKNALDKMTPDKQVLNILWFEYDFHNIKTMIKAKLSDKPFEEIKDLLSKMGAIDIEKLRKFIFDNEEVIFGLDEYIEKEIKEKIKKVQKLFIKEKNNPQVIDLYLDQKLIKIIYKTALFSKNQFLINYVKTLIDLTNIRLLFRMKAQDKDQHLFEIALLWHGNIKASKLKDAYKHNLNEFPELMKSTLYAKLISEGFKHYEKEKNFMALEKEIENYLTNSIKTAKRVTFGPEPLIAYFLAKKNNALIIRMILINKLNKVNPEEIKNRLRELYI